MKNRKKSAKIDKTILDIRFKVHRWVNDRGLPEYGNKVLQVKIGEQWFTVPLIIEDVKLTV